VLDNYIEKNCWYIYNEKINVRDKNESRINTGQNKGIKKQYYIESPLVNYYATFYFISYNEYMPIFAVVNSMDANTYEDVILNAKPIIDKGFYAAKERANVYFKNGDIDKGISVYNSLMVDYPTKKEDLFEIKIAQLNLYKQYQMALENCNIALGIYPKNINLKCCKVLSLAGLKKLDSSIELLQELILLRKLGDIENDKYVLSTANMFCLLGDAYFHKSNYDESLKAYSIGVKALDDSAFVSMAYYNMALIKEKRLEFEESIQLYNIALKYYTKNQPKEKAQAFYNRGIMHRKLNQLNLAINDYSSAIDINVEYALAYNNRGFVYNLLKETKKAEEDFNLAYKFAKDDEIKALALTNLLDLTFQSEEYTKCVKTANLLLAISKQDKKRLGTAYFFRGSSKLLLNNIDEGCKDINTAKELGIDVPAEIVLFCK
jgi:tetratricopeptide (TPR) repeat protein